MNRKGVGYVIIRQKEANGILFEEPTVELKQEKKFILNHQLGGTAFVIEKFDRPFQIKSSNYFGLGVAITASHTCYSPLTFLEELEEIDCGFSVQQMGIMKLIPLKCFCINSNEELYASNNNPYCLPGDIAICLLVSEIADLYFEVIPLSICQKNSPCSIIGFPTINVENPISIYPYFGDDKQNAINKIIAVFHKDKALVESKGKVLRNKKLLEISCSAINGMSGSPVIVNDCAVGVFVGGPPLPGQRDLIKLASFIKLRKNKDEAWCLFHSLRNNDVYYKRPIFENLNNLCRVKLYFLGWFLTENSPFPTELAMFYSDLSKNNFDPTELMRISKPSCINNIFSTLYSCVAYYKNANELSFNTAISTKHSIFAKITKLLHEFSLIDKQSISISKIHNFFEYN
ncbi:hypothetical protein SteCoe_22225 [Stentor coeruleus]|uniref:Uncharacterized protein n=1 Tax=Stentor coeruleus TaxID=5963 RepID=A0A1R2BML9_9CILI|nr:hypothetical protein SteCoe_22225 [Stentor coeruleus]